VAAVFLIDFTLIFTVIVVHFSISFPGKFFEMSSFSETKAASLIENELERFQEFNLRHMSRIYPKGTRADSSNYKPGLYWSAGCQMGKISFLKRRA